MAHHHKLDGQYVALHASCKFYYTCKQYDLCRYIPDIDKCATDTDLCHQDASCMKIDGGYSCVCNGGYTGDGLECTGKIFVHDCILGYMYNTQG